MKNCAELKFLKVAWSRTYEHHWCGGHQARHLSSASISVH